MWEKIKTAAKSAVQSRFSSRSFLIVVFFSITGFWLEAHGKLSPNYAALATALTGFHIWRARGEDDKDSEK